MPRIRTLKPEFFTSPDVAAVGFPVRLFYQALWCWADDFGIGETNLNGLLGFAFPDSDGFSAQDLRRFCADCAQHFGITFYTVRGRHYYAIKSWDAHQKTERREQRRRHPTPDDPEALPDQRIYGCADFAPEVPRKTGAESGEMCAGTGEQGNRGTGEKENVRTPVQTEPHSDEPAPASAMVATRGADLVRANVPKGHPGATLTSLRLQASELLNTGTDPEIVAAGLRLWSDKPSVGIGRTILSSMCSEVIKSRAAPKRRSTTDDRVMATQSLKAKYLAEETNTPELSIAPMGELA